MRGVPEMLRPLRDRIQMAIGRGTIARVDDTTGFQSVQVEMLADETHDAVEHFQSYGFAAHPKAGAEGVMLAVGGLRSHGLMIAVGDRRYRMTGLAEGEVAIYDDQGQHALLGRDGIVIAGKKLTFTSDDVIAFTGHHVTFTADHIALATDDLILGNGASLAAARKTDAVASGAISAGSTKVKIA